MPTGPKKVYTPLDLAWNQLLNVLLHVAASDPSTPQEGQVYYDSTNKRFKYHNGTSFVSDTDRARHTGTQLAATISDFDTQVRTSRLDQMAAPTGSVAMNSQRITGLADASADTDAASWGQVKSLVRGLDWKDSVVVAVSSNVNTSSPGASLDGVAMSSGDRVLLTAQSTGSQNGPWVWNGAASAMTRPVDWVTGLASGGAVFPIEQGTSADKLAICTTNGAITVDTTSTAFTVMSAGSTYSAGTGLTESPAGTFNVDTSVVARHVTALIGNGSDKSLVVTHNLGNRWVHTSVYEASGSPDGEKVECGVRLLNSNQVEFHFEPSAPTVNEFRVVIVG